MYSHLNLIDPQTIEIEKRRHDNISVCFNDNSPIYFKIGLKADPLKAASKLMPAFNPKNKEARATLDVAVDHETATRLMGVFEQVMSNPDTPQWARNLKLPLLEDNSILRTKVDQRASVMKMQNGLTAGPGSFKDVVCGADLVLACVLGDPWKFTPEGKDEEVAGISVIVDHILVDNSTVEVAAKKPKVEW